MIHPYGFMGQGKGGRGWWQIILWVYICWEILWIEQEILEDLVWSGLGGLWLWGRLKCGEAPGVGRFQCGEAPVWGGASWRCRVGPECCLGRWRRRIFISQVWEGVLVVLFE